MEEVKKTKISDIKIQITLNEAQVPVKMAWSSTDMHKEGEMEDCKAMALALFDKNHRDTLRIDLWTDEMQVQEMDRFMFQTLRSLASTYFKATNNKELAEDMARFAEYFGETAGIVPKEQ